MRPASRNTHKPHRFALTLALTAVLACATALLAPAVGQAAYTRPPLCESAAGPLGDGWPAITIGPEEHAWVSEPVEQTTEGPPALGISRLRQFQTAAECEANKKLAEVGKPVQIEGQTAAQSLAYDPSTDAFYLAGQSWGQNNGHLEAYDLAGNLVSRSAHAFAYPFRLAVDASTSPLDPLAGSIALTHGSNFSEPPEPSGIERFSSTGAPLGFTGAGNGKGCPKYIEHEQIVGTEENCGVFSKSLAVDTHGDVFAAIEGGLPHEAEVGVYEYGPEGEFVRVFTGKETPGLKLEGKNRGGFGGALSGVAVDPVSGDVLVSVVSGAETVGEENEGAIDEFSAAGRYLNQITTTPAGAGLGRVGALTVDGHGDLYVTENVEHAVPRGSEAEGRVYAYGPVASLPGVRLFGVVSRRATSAVLEGSVDPEGKPLSECRFEYVTEAQFTKTGFAGAAEAACEPAANGIAPDSLYHPVRASIAGLVSGATYRYRLSATNTGELSGTASSEALAFTTPHAPRIDATSVSDVSSMFAELHAQIAPLGADTRYRFQYVPQAGYQPGAQEPYAAGVTAPGVAVDIGSGGVTGSTPVSVARQIDGLTPGTTYHFRVLAESTIEGADEVTFGPDETFATLPAPSPGLPDGRAYELVTPPDKGAAADTFAVNQTGGELLNNDDGYSSVSGNQFLFTTFSAFGPFPGSGHNLYVFRRDAQRGEWMYTPLASPALGVQSLESGAFDPADLSRLAFTDYAGSQASANGTLGHTLVGAPGGPYADLHTDAPALNASKSLEGTAIAGASRDLGHLVLQSYGDSLCGGEEGKDPGSLSLCEWSGGYESEGGVPRPQLSLVNVDDEGALLSPCGAVLGAGPSDGSAGEAVSADGSVIVFTAPDPQPRSAGAGCWDNAASPQRNTPQVYIRANGETIEVSAPEEGVSDPSCTAGDPACHPGEYVGASEDGSRIYFISEGELTGEAQQLGLHDAELYEYDLAARTLTRISAGEPGSPARAPGAGGQVYGVSAVAAEGTAVYFTSLAQLTVDAPASEGEPEVYRYDTATGKTAYIATVNALDFPADSLEWRGKVGTAPKAGEVSLAPQAPWYTTPDGRYLLFGTTRELVPGYSTIGDCTIPYDNDAKDGHCIELYRYDAQTGGLVCVSCDPDGAPPVANASFTRSARDDVFAAAGPVRAMSDDGSYVFFDTGDPLAPGDTNGALDVYEWHEQAGSGAGHVSLISSGQDPAASFLLSSSADGANVFIGTHARLVAQDTDTNGDVYDARICTASEPCFKPGIAGSGVCEGDSCQSPPPAPIDATPASATFTGPGDVAPEPVVRPRAKQLRRAQKLAKALEACRAKTGRQRVACERRARRAYGPVRGSKKSRNGGR